MFHRRLLLGFTCILFSLNSADFAYSKQLTFRYRGSKSIRNVYLASPLNNWIAEETPVPQVSPGLFELQIEAPWIQDFEYKFVVDGQWVTDPTNPALVPDGQGGWNSVLDTGFREDPDLTLHHSTPPPTLYQWQVSGLQGEDRVISATVPFQVRQWRQEPSAKKDLIFLYFQDGNDYLWKSGATSLIANLSADPDLPLLVGVFLPPVDRMNEYGLTEKTDAYGALLTEEILPHTERHLIPKGFDPSRVKRVLIGPSLGGLATVYLALKYPQLFHGAASQSGSFWMKPWIIYALLKNAGSLHPKFWLDVGTYEVASMAESNRRLRSQFGEFGFEVSYHEYPSLHDWVSWRNRLQLILRHFADSLTKMDTQPAGIRTGI